ncbi:CPCC family cysteine-rich protein [Clostridium sp.]|uniref:CPCC family cysteine-rich protein n=1 Tax=Clostridium sp. TaxID=1506 RepID=UPI003430AB45
MGDSPYPCCRYITIPNKGDALAYICPVCCWEIDLNNGLRLKEARYNYKVFGVSQKRLKLNKYKLREFCEGENV